MLFANNRQRGCKMAWKKRMSGSLLVAGTTVGAGMLGIPAVTMNAGFMPGMIITGLVWLFMLITGWLLLDVALQCPKGSNILTIAKKYLGKGGRVFAGGMFVFLYYCLLVAYIAGGSPLLEGLFACMGIVGLPSCFYYMLFTVSVALIIYSGMRWIDRSNIFLTVGMIVTFILMWVLGLPAVDSARLYDHPHYSKMFVAVPLLFGAFGYHNVIPSLCDYLERDRRSLRISLVVGTFLAMSLYVLWQYLVLGSVDVALLQRAVEEGQTVIFSLQQVVASSSLFVWGKWFGALALLTSFLGVSLSMVDFFADGCSLFSWKGHRWMFCLLTFLPPLLFTLYNPAVFTQALGVAGGIGESVLNGLLPIAVLWVSVYVVKERLPRSWLYSKGVLSLLFTLGIAVFFLELYELWNQM